MMNDQLTRAIVVLFLCLRIACGQQYELNYGAGYHAYPLATTSNAFEPPNDVIHASSSSSNFGTHRPPLSVWSAAPIVVGDYGTQTLPPPAPPPAAGFDNVRHDYAAPPRDYVGAYLPTQHFDSRRQDEVYPTRAANHRYDNQGDDADEAVVVDSDFYNRQQLLRSLNRGRGAAQGQPSLLAGGSENPAYTPAYGRADAGSFFEPPLPLYRRQLASPASNKFAAHFAEYLRKNPQRLRPIYEPTANGIKK